MAEFAVVKTGGKQYRVAKGDKLRVEKLDSGDKKIKIDEVLLICNGDKTELGKPNIAKAFVEAKIISNGRGEKIKIVKFKPKKRYKKTQGHRQDFTEIEITKISN